MIKLLSGKPRKKSSLEDIKDNMGLKDGFIDSRGCIGGERVFSEGEFDPAKNVERKTGKKIVRQESKCCGAPFQEYWGGRLAAHIICTKCNYPTTRVIILG